jgi:hypothetical protein
MAAPAIKPKGIEHTRRDRNPDQVVDKGEEQLLPDIAHHGFAQLQGFYRTIQISFYKGQTCTFTLVLHGPGSKESLARATVPEPVGCP